MWAGNISRFRSREVHFYYEFFFSFCVVVDCLLKTVSPSSLNFQDGIEKTFLFKQRSTISLTTDKRCHLRASRIPRLQILLLPLSLLRMSCKHNTTAIDWRKWNTVTINSWQWCLNISILYSKVFCQAFRRFPTTQTQHVRNDRHFRNDQGINFWTEVNNIEYLRGELPCTFFRTFGVSRHKNPEEKSQTLHVCFWKHK